MGVRNFTMGICPKMNLIERLKFELAYYEFAVQQFNQLTTKLTLRFYWGMGTNGKGKHKVINGLEPLQF